jgi:hypothetical protein
MAIEKRQPGEAAAAAKAGTIVGTSQKTKREEAQAEQARQQQMAIKAREAAEQRAMEWELQKMQMRFEQDFAQELRTRQYDLDRFNRAKEWDIEKMELRSRMDFQQEEQKRLQELDRIDSKILALRKAKEDGQFTGREFEFESMMFNLEQQQFGIKNPSRPLDPQERLLDQMVRGGGVGGGVGTGGVGTAPSGLDAPPAGPIHVKNMEAIAATGKTYVRRKSDGVNVEVPVENAKKAIDTGRYEWPDVVGGDDGGERPAKPGLLQQISPLVVGINAIKTFGKDKTIYAISPNGEWEKLRLGDWSQYKKRGYTHAVFNKPPMKERFDF